MNLDKESLFVLRYIYKKEVITYGKIKQRFPRKPILDLLSALSTEKAIRCEFVQKRTSNKQHGFFLCEESKICCTTLGKKYVEDYLEKQKTKTIESIRYWITTTIALAAFIKSFFF